MSKAYQQHTLGDFLLQLDGKTLAAEALTTLLGIRVQQRLSMPALAEIVFHSHADFSVEELMPEIGADLNITLRGQDTQLFTGNITAKEFVYGAAGETRLHIRAYDALHHLYRQQQVRVHVKTNIRTLAQEWTSPVGLRLSSHLTEAPPDWRWKIQYRQSDGEWLAQLAHAQGYYLQVHDGTLHLLTLAGMEPLLPLEPGVNLREARFTENGQYQCDHVQVTGWDPAETRNINGQAGSRPAAEKHTRHLIDYPASNPAQAGRMASAVMERCHSGEQQFWGVAEGNPELYPGQKVQINGIARSLPAAYTLTSVTHTADAATGYMTELGTAPPEIPAPRHAPVKAILGVVSNIDDPQHSGRVKVSLPVYNNTETDWLHVVQAAAGKDKGLLALPSCGDKVILLPLTDDPAQAVVLGGVYGMDNLPDEPVKGDEVTRYAFHTPNGHYLRFDEARNRTTLHHSNGSFLEFTPGKTRIHSKTDLILEAPGKDILIRGDRIDLEKAS